MNKKGFTLVELLAVLVLLALIAIIIMPNALRTTSKTEKNAFTESVKGLIRGLDEYYAANGTDMQEYADCTMEMRPVYNCLASDDCFDLCITTEDIPNDVDIEKVDKFTSGYIINRNGTYEVYNITDGVYCANGKRNSLTITNGNCE